MLKALLATTAVALALAGPAAAQQHATPAQGAAETPESTDMSTDTMLDRTKAAQQSGAADLSERTGPPEAAADDPAQAPNTLQQGDATRDPTTEGASEPGEIAGQTALGEGKETPAEPKPEVNLGAETGKGPAVQAVPQPDPDDVAGSATSRDAQREATRSSADAANASPGNAPVFLERPDRDSMSASRVLGMTVTDRDGNELGSVEDILLNPDGRIAGVVVARGGVLGVGGKRVAIAFERLEVIADDDRIAVDVDQQTLEQAPEYQTAENPR